MRSPRSDSVKRKKVSTPESSTQNAPEKSSEVTEKKEPATKEDDKDGKKSKKEKGKEETLPSKNYWKKQCLVILIIEEAMFGNTGPQNLKRKNL